MYTTLEYHIIAVAFHGEKATHEELQEKVQDLIDKGFEPLGRPFFGDRMMYQAMTRSGEKPQTGESPRGFQ